MKLLNGEIFEVREPLHKLMKKELPVKVAYDLAKIASKLNEQLKVIEDVRQGLVRKYGDRDNKEKRLEVNPEGENFEKFMVELDELMKQEVEVVIQKVKLPQEVDGKPLQIEPAAMMALEKFVEVA